MGENGFSIINVKPHRTFIWKYLASDLLILERENKVWEKSDRDQNPYMIHVAGDS